MWPTMLSVPAKYITQIAPETKRGAGDHREHDMKDRLGTGIHYPR